MRLWGARLFVSCTLVFLPFTAAGQAPGGGAPQIDPDVEAALADALLDPPPPAEGAEPFPEWDAVADETVADKTIGEGALDAALGGTAGVDPAAAAAGMEGSLKDDALPLGDAGLGTLGMVPPVPEPDPLGDSFRLFCTDWMGKLAERETRNSQNIAWETGLDWVQGSYVGYTADHTCEVMDKESDAPVGRISYLEIKWEKRGMTIPLADGTQPTAVETTEVTEFFRYGDEGTWEY